MKQAQILALARDAGFKVYEGAFPFEPTEDKFIGFEDNLERFAALVAAHEREACAKVCDEIAVKEWDAYKGRTEPLDKDKLYNPHIEGISDGADECAAAIRARGEK